MTRSHPETTLRPRLTTGAFSCILRAVKPVFWLGTAAAALVIAGCGSGSDKVVGIVVACEEGRLTGEACRAASGANAGIAWRRGTQKELTIRTPKGDTYSVLVAPETTVALGDEWPPD